MAAPVTSVSNTVPITNRNINISDRFAAQCTAVIDSNYDTAGSITRASINGLTKNQLDALFTPAGLFADLTAWFRHSVEMRACGVERFALYDWIMANADRTNFRAALFPGIKAVKGPSLLQPFIMAKQMSIINRDHWQITQGGNLTAPTASTVGQALTLQSRYTDSSGNNHDATKWIRVESRYGVPVNQAFFRPMDTVHIFNSASGLSQHGAWRVVDSVHEANQAYCYVALLNINAAGGEAYDTSPGQNLACYMVPGLNNVNDYEKWCYNRPTLDGRKMVPFWRQVSRRTRAVDSEYLLVYARLMESNEAFREFGDLPLAERNKQDEVEEQKRFVNDFFYNKPLTNQDLVNWQSLQQINSTDGNDLTLGIGSKLVAYRANFIGAREQLRVCAQVFDLVNHPLNWYEWLNLNYSIMRARNTFYGKQITDIDWHTSNGYLALMHQAYSTYCNQVWPGLSPQILVKPDEVDKLGRPYRTFKVHYPSGININVIGDYFFDDRLDQFQNGISGSTDQTFAGNLLWCVDIGKPRAGSIYWAHIAANRRQTTTASINELSKLDSTFRCVMEVVSIDTTLTSNEGTVVLECPLGNAMIEGISFVIPNTSGIVKTAGVTGSSYYDLY